MASSANINRGYDSALERDLARVLTELLGSASWLQRWRIEPGMSGDPEWDLLVSGPVPGGGKAVLCVECKGINFQPSQFASLVGRSCSAGKNVASGKVLAMPRVSPRMAELCHEHGWNWYDLAGNCRLEIPGVLLIERSGKEPVKSQPRSGANLSTPEAARVVRALLAPENAGQRWTQREMVAHFAGLVPRVPAPSLALVNKVVQHLRDQAFLEQLPNRGFRVRDFEGLLLAWRAAYRFDRHSRRPYFTLLQGRALQDRLRALDPDGEGRLAYAAFSAADLQAPAVRQPRTWLYLDPNIEQEFQSAVEAKSVDSGENLVVLFPDDAGVFYRAEAGSNRVACTNAVQTYVDLAHSGGRGEEAAEALLQQRLKPAWSAAAK
ncbi:MAG: type IV toxin-antitoxin system AbiEi family antitoxin [Vicinamibacterales bacterium]|nr:type IV toxin-antitoxin system AbiEi family antitoxin [Vicinamibacterales bacterium]